MKSDRELLELAAKAAGYAIYFGDKNCRAGKWKKSSGEARIFWNPLEDDGDALRLAVRLKMVIDTDYNGGSVAGNAGVDFCEPEAGNPFSATRRAIVIAAAEIGKSMP